MTSEEIVKSLRCCAVYNGVLCNELGCKLVDKGTGVCRDILEFTAAELIERLEKEKAALMESVRKSCDCCASCKYSEPPCEGDVFCMDCGESCMCRDCEAGSKWEWKGVED